MFKKLSGDEPFRVAFLLVPNFSLMAFASTIEPLRVANRLAGKQLYRWTLLSIAGGGVASSGGLLIMSDHPIETAPRMDMLAIIAGFDPGKFITPKELAWLRRIARAGVWVAGVDTGSYVMAMANLLESSRATTHWEHHEVFLNDFPTVKLSQEVFVADENRLTAAGGTACIDMMLNMISEQHGYQLATEVSDQFIYSRIRPGTDAQRMHLRDRLNVSNPVLINTIEVMEKNTEEPLTMKEVASHVGTSLRELERLFSQWLKVTPSFYYRQLRLIKARNLLLHTASSVTEVAFSCGFASVANFSRSYKAMYGVSPKASRLNPH